MAVDLFEDEQQIFDEAMSRIVSVENGAAFDFTEFVVLTEEYGKLLKQLRRSTRIADRTAIDLHESNLDLKDKVHYDVLTGIYNRRFMEDSLTRTIKSVSRSGGELSVMMMDIDFFKRYNDTYGHSTGDICLTSVAQALSGCVTRADDFVARYGGEEFIMVLSNTGESGVRVMANRVLEKVRALHIPHERNEAANCVTISIGVTTGIATHTHSSTDYIKRADEALYLSKRRGRNRYTYLDFKEEQE